MTENPHRTKRTRSTLAVILPLLAIGVVAWVMLALMACGASSEPTGGEAERSEAADAETPQTSEIPEAAEAWLPVAGALLSEDEQTGEMVKVADVAIERDERGLVACVTETSYEGGAESTSTQTRYAYDEAGRVVSREAAFENALSPDSASTFTTDYVYDQDRLAMITTPETESTGRELFDYDERDHLITIMQTYDVDEAARLRHLAAAAQSVMEGGEENEE